MKEHEKAAAWRDRLGLDNAKLAKLSGYSEITLYWMFRGQTPPRTKRHVAGKAKSGPIEEAAWQRFRNVCCAVEKQLADGKRFDW